MIAPKPRLDLAQFQQDFEELTSGRLVLTAEWAGPGFIKVGFHYPDTGYGFYFAILQDKEDTRSTAEGLLALLNGGAEPARATIQ